LILRQGYVTAIVTIDSGKPLISRTAQIRGFLALIRGERRNAADCAVIARLALLGFDVFAQRKSNLKRYDLLAVDDRDVSLKISVKVAEWMDR
jgi:hypothetical protein